MSTNPGQPAGADEFFTTDQQGRLAELMTRWRQARDAGVALPPTEQAELEALTAAELRAATARASAPSPRLGRPGM